MTKTQKVSRRKFLVTSSGLAAGSVLAVGSAEARRGGATKTKTTIRSGLQTGKPVPLRYSSIPGFLSAKQLAPHFSAHYGGALRGYVSLDSQLESSSQSSTTIDASAYATMQRGRSKKANSVLLHELYFGGMSLTKNSAKAEVRSAIVKRFGSMEKWAADFQACAKSASGWAMLAYHSVNKKMYNVVSDGHANGVLWMSTPLVVIDMYEHAYYLDYKNDKGRYIHSYMNHIDWRVVNARCIAASA